MMLVYYYERYIQQRQREFEREAQQQRLARSIRPEGHAPFLNRLGEWFMGLSLQLKPNRQMQSQPGAITGNL
jgi:hypothetical protein